MLVALMLSVMLVACGDDASTATIPSYTGATTLTLPDAAKTSFGSSLKDAKNVKIDAYKTSDDSAKVKSFFADNLSKGGWADKSGDISKDSGDSIKSFESLGGFILGYEKGGRQVAVLGMPNVAAGPLGFTDVGPNDTLYLVISGDK